MKKRKGLSLEEKRERMLSVFKKTLEVYNFKEIEKFSIKAGIGVLTSFSKCERGA